MVVGVPKESAPGERRVAMVPDVVKRLAAKDVEVAGESGGNCELTEPGEVVVKHDVTIVSPLNLPTTMPEHASQLYARNVQSLLELMLDDEGNVNLDFEDEIIAGACVTRDGEIVHEGAKETVEGAAA